MQPEQNKSTQTTFHISCDMLLSSTINTGDPRSTQSNRTEHDLHVAAHHRAAHNPAARWFAVSVACVTCMCEPSSQPSIASQTAM